MAAGYPRLRRNIREGLIAAGLFSAEELLVSAEELNVGTPVPQDLRGIPDEQLLRAG